jgi:undecaprenyl diphosphate synthase
MDGNGRWAQARNLPRLAGHERGVAALREIMTSCREWGIEYLTVYAFSTENWRRAPEEVNGLMALLDWYLRSEIDNLRRDDVRLFVIGDISRLKPELQTALKNATAALANCRHHTLTLALNYGGRDEIVRAARQLATQVAKGKLAPDEIDEEKIGAALDHPDLPDPDLIIRTAGEQRLSNFLLWQSSYAELYFSDVCWPDFSPNELARALTAYSDRRRKFGAIK